MSSITHNSIETEAIIAALKQRIVELEAHAKREWVRLTDEEIGVPSEPIQPHEAVLFARVIEALLKEKNREQN